MALTDDRHGRGKQAADAERKWFTARQAATYTGFSAHYIRDAANEGRLKGVRSRPGPKGQWRFLAEDLDVFVRNAALGPRKKGA